MGSSLGTNISALNPSGMISQIAPRPILLIYGGNEVSLPGGYQQKAAAGDNAELWIIPGTTHGNYRQVAGEEYEKRVIRFFEAILNK
jgi:pimeloyl-ACP methyl ester carboxylesterase